MSFLKNILGHSLKKSLTTTGWLMKIIVPVSLVVSFLDYFGALEIIAGYLDPLFIYMGLPGSTAIIFITSIFLPLYAPLGIIISMSVTLRELTILALMCQVSHNLLVESAIQAKTGTSFRAMFILRILTSIVIGLVLNLILPQDMGMPLFVTTAASAAGSVNEVLMTWLINSLKMGLIIFGIITLLNVLYRLLEEYNLVAKISKSAEPVLKVFGLSKSVGFLWIIGYLVGLAYGGAMMMDQMNEGKVSEKDAKLLNYHLAISHSVIEDNLLFVALGVSYLLILAVRFAAAIIVVWFARLIIFLRTRQSLSRAGV